MFDVNIHTGIISGKDWVVGSAWVTTDVQAVWWSAGLEMFFLFFPEGSDMFAQMMLPASLGLWDKCGPQNEVYK